MLTLLLALSVAQADEGLRLQLQGGAVLNGAQPAASLAAALEGHRDARVYAEARAAGSGAALVRTGIGVDLLGGSDLDVRIGLFAGGKGVWTAQTLDPTWITGGELTAGARLGRVEGSLRWLGGFGDGSLSALHTETQAQLAFRVLGTSVLYGRVLRATGSTALPSDQVALELGLRWTL
ncbi:MAG: hypothetical protein JXX28_18480 [Deltaproteobacteria bacterium]|nr:hypothetical protein [Deltaproteobacteria bacterium]